MHVFVFLLEETLLDEEHSPECYVAYTEQGGAVHESTFGSYRRKLEQKKEHMTIYITLLLVELV